MPRANRHTLPGHVWHITHRCHRQQFLLKFTRDRRLWRDWLFEARHRFGLWGRKGVGSLFKIFPPCSGAGSVVEELIPKR